ncbi:MAG: hypothetical protein L0Z62_28045 [Gemmataceae bacterium]|nr:hypothetical protein [Gemmataceae bacterium]
MIDLADDHYELDITRARTLLGWGPKRAARHAPQDGRRAQGDPVCWYREHKLEPPSWLEATAARPPREKSHAD